MEDKPTPTIAFSEDELKKIVEYLNFISKHADFSVKEASIVEYMNLKRHVIDHVRKCEKHIFEIREHIKAKPKKDDK